jgi:hypothetical protein
VALHLLLLLLPLLPNPPRGDQPMCCHYLLLLLPLLLLPLGPLCWAGHGGWPTRHRQHQHQHQHLLLLQFAGWTAWGWTGVQRTQAVLLLLLLLLLP